MARSLSLAAYLAFSRRASGPIRTPKTKRPTGEVIWAHMTDAAHSDALVQLLDRLRAQRPDMNLLLTTGEAKAPERIRDLSNVIFEALDGDTLSEAEAFLDHWKPDFALWTGGDLQPAFIETAAQQNIPMALVDADEDLLIRPSWRWFPDLPRALMQHFEFILARDEDTARFLRRIGVGSQDLIVTGRFLDGGVTLPHNETDREEMAQLLLGRPVWLAARVHLKEVQIVLAAHKEVSKLSHRAVLILVPEDPEDRESYADVLRQSGNRFLFWSEGDLPDESTQIVLADTRGEMGLWYRVAPVSFMANSLQSGAHGCDPNEPAAHGSAIIHGPYVKNYAATYARFSDAGAARGAHNSETLARAVSDLLQPDQSAIMAHAAWEVSSRNAALTDMIAERILDRLDHNEAI